ncbi:MAG: redoxin family protein [Actinomycetes bacterium]
MRFPDALPAIKRLLPTLAVGGALALGLAACGAESETSVAANPSSASSASAQGDQEKKDKQEPTVDTSNSVLPSVQVKDVEGGEVNLADLVPSQKPILLWAWAPHCPACAAEAPAVEEFSKKNANAVTVVGIGTQDDFAFAEDFVSTYGVSTPQMLWDPGFESWQALEITGQPTWVLLSPGGEEIGRWQGGLPESDILDQV